MTTITRSPKIRHYASFMLNGQEVCGTAERIDGGWIFRPDEAPRTAVLVDYRNVELFLFGVVSIAQDQWHRDEANGGLVATCSRTVRS